MKKLISALQEIDNKPLSVTLGFDGFVDTIIKLVHHRNADGGNVYFDSVKDWGEYITERVGKSFTIELSNMAIKLGGNMPIMANALANLGLNINCVGAMGHPNVHAVFEQMSKRCSLLSYAVPGLTQALEFKDGKIMLGNVEDLNHTDWPNVKERVGLDALIKATEPSALIGMLNWGELEKSTSVWKGFLHEVLPSCKHVNPIIFADLSDCSKRSHEEIKEILLLLQDSSSHGKVILSINLNEAHTLHKVIYSKPAEENDLSKLGEKLLQKLELNMLLLHNRKEAAAVTRERSARRPSLFVENPKLLTGAGDNFNAGFCLGQLLHLDLDDSLIVAHSVSNHYIQNGSSPTVIELLERMELK